MDKQKQIEEMAMDMLSFGMATYPTSDSVFTETKLREQFYRVFLAYAENLVQKGWVKPPEGAVVILKEQNENWLSFLEQNIEKARKEAVEKFVELLLSEYAAFEEENEILIKDMRGDIQDVAKAFIGGEYAERTI